MLNKTTMLFSFLQKQKSKEIKRKLIISMIDSLEIPKQQKELYISALEILNEVELDILYKNIIGFVKDIEMKDIEEIHKKNFIDITGMQKKEAQERKQEMNSFSFLLHNL